MALWRRQAENQCKAFGLVMGAQHAPERLKCLAILVEQHEKNDAAFPKEFIFNLWEELWATWGE